MRKVLWTTHVYVAHCNRVLHFSNARARVDEAADLGIGLETHELGEGIGCDHPLQNPGRGVQSRELLGRSETRNLCNTYLKTHNNTRSLSLSFSRLLVPAIPDCRTSASGPPLG